MNKVVISKNLFLLIISLSLYITLISYFMPIRIPCIYQGNECPIVRYGFPSVVYEIRGEFVHNPYKNYWALPENFVFWLIVLFAFYAIVRVGMGTMKKISDNK